MAQERVQIRLDAVDNTRKALNGLKGRLDKVKSSVFNLRNSFLAIGAGLVVKGFIDAGIQVENLGVQLKTLFGSAKAGEKALKSITQFAAKTPFELRNIQQGVTSLAVVREQAEKAGLSFDDLLTLTGNVAAQMGGDFAFASFQIQKAFSTGIAAAESLKERGIAGMAGFEAGVSVNADGTIKKMNKAFGKDGKFGNLMDELSKTLFGTITNIKDAFFIFQVEVSKGFFTALKQNLGDLKKTAEENRKEIAKFGAVIGKGLSKAIQGTSDALKFLKNNFEFLKNTILAVIGIKIVTFFGQFILLIGKLRNAMLLLNVAMLANPLFLGVAAVALVVAGIYSITNAMKDAKKATDAWAISLGYIDQDAFDKAMGMTKEDDIVGILKRPKAKTFFEDDEDDKVGDVISDKSIKQIEELTKAIQEYKKAFEASFGGQVLIQAQASLDKMESTFKNINQILAKTAIDGIGALSKGIAESIILGKSLGDTFRQFVQQSIVNALASLIQYYATKLLIYAIEKLFGIEIPKQVDLEKRKLDVLKKQTSELKKQAVLQLIITALGGGGGFNPFGSAEGGRVNGTRANGGQTQNGNSYIVGERGRELFIPSTDGQIVSNENLNGMGATNINFTVQATDVKGVQELLIDNRATITNIINTALNQKGKPALV